MENNNTTFTLNGTTYETDDADTRRFLIDAIETYEAGGRKDATYLQAVFTIAQLKGTLAEVA